MRTSFLAVAALALASSACKPMAPGNRSSREASGPEPAATITLASRGGSDCAARWNGEAVTQEAIMQRGVAALEAGIRAVGGAANISEETIPFVRIEAPADMAYACLGTTLASLQRAGFAWIVLRPVGGGADARADFFIGDMPPPPVPPPPNVVIGRGSLSYQGAPSSLSAIAADIRRLSEGEAPPPGQDPASGPPPATSAPNGFIVQVASDVAFGELHALARTVAEEGQTATLYGCAGPTGPSWLALPAC